MQGLWERLRIRQQGPFPAAAQGRERPLAEAAVHPSLVQLLQPGLVHLGGGLPMLAGRSAASALLPDPGQALLEHSRCTEIVFAC